MLSYAQAVASCVAETAYVSGSSNRGSSVHIVDALFKCINWSAVIALSKRSLITWKFSTRILPKAILKQKQVWPMELYLKMAMKYVKITG